MHVKIKQSQFKVHLQGLSGAFNSRWHLQYYLCQEGPPPSQLVGWSECLKENTKTTRQDTMKLGRKLGNEPLHFGADPT